MTSLLACLFTADAIAPSMPCVTCHCHAAVTLEEVDEILEEYAGPFIAGKVLPKCSLLSLSSLLPPPLTSSTHLLPGHHRRRYPLGAVS